MSRHLTIYVIFHSRVYPQNTQAFTTNEIKKVFTWVAVNEAIPKQIPLQMASFPMIQEWKMRFHNPSLQRSRYYQNSFFFHLYRNQEYLQSKFVGFAQYDMEFERRSLPTNLIDDHVYGYWLAGIPSITDPYPVAWWQTFFLDPYNKFYGTSHTFEDIYTQPLFIYHTFIIPTSYFLHLMPFIEHDTPIIVDYLKSTQHIAGTLERVFAMCIACALLEGKLKGYTLMSGINHRHTEQRMRDPSRGMI